MKRSVKYSEKGIVFAVLKGKRNRVKFTVDLSDNSNPLFSVQVLKNSYDPSTPYWLALKAYSGHDFNEACRVLEEYIPKAKLPPQFMRYHFKPKDGLYKPYPEIRNTHNWKTRNENLIRAIFDNGFSLNEFAEKMNVNLRSVQSWVFKSVNPIDFRKREPARILNCDIDWLFPTKEKNK